MRYCWLKCIMSVQSTAQTDTIRSDLRIVRGLRNLSRIFLTVILKWKGIYFLHWVDYTSIITIVEPVGNGFPWRQFKLSAHWTENADLETHYNEILSLSADKNGIFSSPTLLWMKKGKDYTLSLTASYDKGPNLVQLLHQRPRLIIAVLSAMIYAAAFYVTADVISSKKGPLQ